MWSSAGIVKFIPVSAECNRRIGPVPSRRTKLHPSTKRERWAMPQGAVANAIKAEAGRLTADADEIEMLYRTQGSLGVLSGSVGCGPFSA
jgi:hypothetical protein